MRSETVWVLMLVGWLVCALPIAALVGHCVLGKGNGIGKAPGQPGIPNRVPR